MINYGIAPPGFRLPDETRAGAVRLLVSDLQRSIEYYTRVLGLRRLDETSDAAALAPHDDGRALIRLHTRAGVRPTRSGALGLYHFAILLPARRALGQFTAHLSRLGVRVASADHLVSEALYLWDPDGLGIEVYADRPRDRWQYDGRQLVMASEPLDLADVIAAGGNRPWTGMPPQTTMGHVHLHVGSLSAAEAFYHRALGLDKTVWDYPGALFMAAGGYHHHLGTNTWSAGASAAPDQAQLLDWELVVPDSDAVSSAAGSLRAAGYATEPAEDGWTAADPWHTRVHVRTP